MGWTHLLDARVPLTNNLAERALRPYVLWRKSSYATQSHRGNLFRPMVLSLVQTAHALKVSAFEFLSDIATEHQATGRVTRRLPLAPVPQLAGP